MKIHVVDLSRDFVEVQLPCASGSSTGTIAYFKVELNLVCRGLVGNPMRISSRPIIEVCRHCHPVRSRNKRRLRSIPVTCGHPGAIRKMFVITLAKQGVSQLIDSNTYTIHIIETESGFDLPFVVPAQSFRSISKVSIDDARLRWYSCSLHVAI